VPTGDHEIEAKQKNWNGFQKIGENSKMADGDGGGVFQSLATSNSALPDLVVGLSGPELQTSAVGTTIDLVGVRIV
jgi:hypothetical protein